MARKVFMSVLGSTPYKECHYVDYRANFKSSNTKFIQVAMCEKVVCNWSSSDVAFVFLTDGVRGSKQKNWLDNGHRDYKTQQVIPSTGLKILLENLHLPCEVKPILIRNGDSSKEIWENFRIIFGCLNPDDEVYFDVTHGFRSLPMLVLVLTNYSKFLKDIKVASVSYGNYESRNEDNEAPIIDLTPLSHLQDWTSAANMFIKTGSTQNISELLENKQLPSLNLFVDEINECRGLDIFKGHSAIQLKHDINKISIHDHTFKELLDRIKQKVDHFEQDDIVNGFRAVDFCIQHRLIQQGVTLLQEFIISFILKDIKEENWLNDFERTVVSGCMSINRLDGFTPKGDTEEEKLKSREIAARVFSLAYKKELCKKVYKGLSLGARNDLNHAGKRLEPKPTGYFGEKLELYFKNVLAILQIQL